MNNNEQFEAGKNQKKRKEMTRRQFLSYTLGGTTAFLVAGPVLPMVRFAVDPLLKKQEAGDHVKVVEVSKITKEPQEFKFKKKQVDGWYESEAELIAWISKDEKGEIFALSPVCKHLGCTIFWNTKGLNEYDCPCHDARYSKDGKNITVSRLPLDEYDVEIINDYVYLGKIKANTRVN